MKKARKKAFQLFTVHCSASLDSLIEVIFFKYVFQ